MPSPPIVLTYAYGTSNAGDHALTLGAISAISKVVPHEEIAVISRWADRDHPYDALSDLEDKFPGIVALSSPFALSRDTRLLRLMEKLLGMFFVAFVLLFPRFAVRALRGNSALQAIANSRLVLCNGGNLLYWNRHRKSLPRLVALLFPCYLARRLGVRYGFLPQTMGPFEGRMSRILFRNVLEGADFVLFREATSLSHARNVADLDEAKVAVVPDLAFFEPSTKVGSGCTTPLLQSTGMEQDRFVAVTLRATQLGDPESSTNQATDRDLLEFVVTKTSELLADIASEMSLGIVIVSQTAIDREVSDLVADRLRSRGLNRVEVLVERDPTRLSQLYEQAAALIGMRLHSLIFGLRRGTPCLGLYLDHFGPKTPGILRQLGLGDFAFELTQATSEELKAAFSKLYTNRLHLRRQIQHSVADGLELELSIIASSISAQSAAGPECVDRVA